jgi:addiction module RelB/DinJ family antitoxin
LTIAGSGDMLSLYMANTATIQIRIDPKIKQRMAKVFADVGLDMSSGFKVYINKVLEQEGIPFPVKREKFLGYPSKEAYKKDVAWTLKHGKRYTSTKEMLDDVLGKEK